MNEDKATRYHRQRRRVQALSLTTTTALLIFIPVSGMGVLLRDALSPLAPHTPPASSLLVVALFALVLTIVLGAVALPFRAVGEWWLERRYGLEAASLAEWLSTYVRTAGLSLALAIGAGVVPAIAWRMTPTWWWLAAALLLGAGQVTLATLAPLLLHWFASVRPVRRPALDDRLRLLADRAGARGGLRVYEWPESSIGRRAQAALVGLGRTRRVLLSDTLLTAFQDDEIEVVVAHELSHYVHRDLWKMACARCGLFVLAFAVAQLLLARVGPALGIAGPPDAAALSLILLAVALTMAVAEPVMSAWSRAHERRADEYALRLTGNAEALLSVLRRLSALNLVEEQPSVLTALLASHPSLTARLAAVRAWQERQTRAGRATG